MLLFVEEQLKSTFKIFVLVLKLMNHAKEYEEKKSILRVASSGVVYGTQASRQAENEG